MEKQPQLKLKIVETAPGPKSVKPLIPSRCVEGELWQMGPHRLFVGDCLDPMNILRLMSAPRAVADLVFTDPPYNEPQMGQAGPNSAFSRPVYDQIVEEGLHRFEAQEFLDLLPLYFGGKVGFGRSVMQGFSVMVWCNDQLSLGYKQWAKNQKGYYQTIPWDKPNSAPKGGGHWPMDFLIWMRKGALWNDRGENECPDTVQRGRVLNFPLLASDRTGHPCPKPAALIENELYLTTKQGDLVVDPFAGRGPVLKACIRTGRRFYGIEQNLAHAGWILAMYEALTGDKAVMI